MIQCNRFKKEVMKMNNNPIQWYPGHMQKAKVQIQDSLKMVDLVIELKDARIPKSSTNPLLEGIIGQKPRLIILNKKDMADDVRSEEWLKYYEKANTKALAIDSAHQNIQGIIIKEIKEMLKAKLEKAKARGIRKKVLRVMVVGIPNVGKSTFINAIVKKRVAKSENRPGVTKSLQWIKIHEDVELLDTPGVLWPKFESRDVAVKLALIGSINDKVVDKKELVFYALRHLSAHYHDKLKSRYDVSTNDLSDEELVDLIAKNMNFIKKSGLSDEEKTYDFILADIRNNRLSNVTWEFLDEQDA